MSTRARRLRPSPFTLRTSKSRRAFTLLEVMIAGGILFMCLFAILALVANGLRNARALQATKTDPRGSIAGMVYYELSHTNQMYEEGEVEGEFEGYNYRAVYHLVGTNGLYQVEVIVSADSSRHSERLTLPFLVHNAAQAQPGVGGRPRR